MNETDAKMLVKMASLYEALVLTACDLVSIDDIGRVFWDCHEDEEEGLEIMQKRIFIANDDIRKHWEYHKTAVPLFYSLDESANGQNRNGYAAVAEQLVEQTEKYTELVKRHNQKLGENAFLTYPSSAMSYVQIDRDIFKILFNKKRSYDGAKNEIGLIKLLIPDFRIGGRIPEVRKTCCQDSGEGIDTSLRGRLLLTKQLLGMAGYDIEELKV